MESKVISLQLLSLSWFGLTARIYFLIESKNQNVPLSHPFLYTKSRSGTFTTKAQMLFSRSLRLVGRNINMYFIAVMEPVKQPVGEERTKKRCCAHARGSQPARIYSIVVSKPGDSLI